MFDDPLDLGMALALGWLDEPGVDGPDEPVDAKAEPEHPEQFWRDWKAKDADEAKKHGVRPF